MTLSPPCLTLCDLLSHCLILCDLFSTCLTLWAVMRSFGGPSSKRRSSTLQPVFLSTTVTCPGAGRPSRLPPLRRAALRRRAVSWELTSARGALSARLGAVTPDSFLQAAAWPGRDARYHRRESSLRDTARGRS